MFYRILADLVLVSHLIFVLFVIFGGLLVLRWKWVIWMHIPVLAWGITIEVMLWVCPLTHLENTLRAAGGRSGYPTSFIEHYLIPILYPRGLTPGVHFILGIALLTLNLLIYAIVIRRLYIDKKP